MLIGNDVTPEICVKLILLSSSSSGPPGITAAPGTIGMLGSILFYCNLL